MTAHLGGGSDTDRVRLELPGHPQYVSVVRLTVAGLANLFDFPFDEAEDLKLAVTEACAHILRRARLRVTFDIEFRFCGGRFEIDIAGRPVEPRVPADPALLRPLGPDLDPEVGMSLVEAIMERLRVTHDDVGGEVRVTMSRGLPAV